MIGLVLAIIGLIAVAGYSSSVDAALSNFSPARAVELIEEKRAGAARLAVMLDNRAPYVNTNLFLGALAEISAVVLAAIATHDRYAAWPTTVAVIFAMAFVSFVLVGVGPRTIGRQHADRIALISVWPLTWTTRLLGPIPKILILLGNAITPGRGYAQGPFASEAEVRELVDLAEANMVIESGESRMIHKVFEFSDTIVREVMVPRTDLVFVEKDKTLRQAMSLCLRSGYSRVPVIDENLDDIIGMAYLKDITKRVYDNHEAEQSERVESIMRSCSFVPDTKPVDDLMREMQNQRIHAVIVVDEYGGTSGMVTIEDILEEIVGEIADEYDNEPNDVERLSDDTWRVSARYSIDDLGDILQVDFDEDDVDTVRGLMAKELGKVPIPGTSVEISGFSFTAESVAGRRNRVGTVLVKRLDEAVGLPHDGTDHKS